MGRIFLSLITLALVSLGLWSYQACAKHAHYYSLVLLFKTPCHSVQENHLLLEQQEESVRFNMAKNEHHFYLKQKINPDKLLISLDDSSQSKIYNYSLLNNTLVVRLNCIETKPPQPIQPPKEALATGPGTSVPPPSLPAAVEESPLSRWEGSISIQNDLPIALHELSVRYSNQAFEVEASGSFFFDIENPQANGQVEVFHHGTFIHSQFFPMGAPIRISLDTSNVINVPF